MTSQPPATTAPTIKKMSLKHEAIAEFMLAHPTAPMGAVAAHFGVTAAWLSIITGSDAFRQYLGELKGEVVETRVLPLRDKLMGLAQASVEKLGKAVDDTQDPRLLLDIADKSAKLLGYGPKPGGNQQGPAHVQQTNIYAVDPELLAQARQTMLAAPTSAPEGVTIEMPAAEELPTSREDTVGEAIAHAAPLPEGKET